jgi:hypothetical protein
MLAQATLFRRFTGPHVKLLHGVVGRIEFTHVLECREAVGCKSTFPVGFSVEHPVVVRPAWPLLCKSDEVTP